MSYAKPSLALLAALVAAFLIASEARAQQYELVDATFTATADNTEGSRMNLDPNADAPDDWTAPVDYAGGSVHVRMEVIDKPSSAPTRLNVCFEGAPGETLSCLPYISDLYTEPGIYEEDYDFSGFWQYDVRDWTEPTNRIAIVLKDEAEDFVQGNPDFYPTQVRLTLTLVAAGATYDPDFEEPEPEPDAGMDGEGGEGGEGGMSASGGEGGASGEAGSEGGEGGTNAGGAGGAGGTSASGAGGTSGLGGTSGTRAPGGGGTNAAPVGPDLDDGQATTNRPGWQVPMGDDGGCTLARASAARGSSACAVLLLGLLALVRVRMRARRR